MLEREKMREEVVGFGDIGYWRQHKTNGYYREVSLAILFVASPIRWMGRFGQKPDSESHEESTEKRDNVLTDPNSVAPDFLQTTPLPTPTE
jgi:hypothetical protein